MKKVLILVVLAVLIIGGFFMFRGNSTAPTDPSTDGENNVEDTDMMHLGENMRGVDLENSQLFWSAERIVGGSHTGTVTIKEGALEVDENDIPRGGSITLDMTGITESKDSEPFLNHISSADFFDVENFPTAMVEITNLEAAGGENFNATADLTIKDSTNEIEFPLKIAEADGVYTATADIEIDRTLWGITFDSASVFKQIGDKAIRDNVPISFEIVTLPMEDETNDEEESADTE